MNIESKKLTLWEKGHCPLLSLDEVPSDAFTTIEDVVETKGALLLRGYDVDSPNAFARATACVSKNTLPYLEGTSPRTKVQGNIYTSTEYPPEAVISLHNELSYSAKWPSRLLFCCVTPATSGGNTLLADSEAILNNMDTTIRSAFVEKGVTYVRNLHGNSGFMVGPSWQSAFETDDRAVIEKYCVENQIDFTWKADGGLRLISKRAATAVHPKSKREVWFNQADQFHPSTNSPEIYSALMELFGDDPFELPQYACFGDGSPIPESMLKEVREAAEKETILFDWQRGDFLIIDNMLMSHGRSPYTGDRKVLVSMSA